jgi:ABC-type phosphate/phosphonate transport system substrate-binding protein
MQGVHVIDEFMRGMHRLESVRVDETGCPDNVDTDGIFGTVVTSDDNAQYTPVLIVASDSTINSRHTVRSERVAEYAD